MKPENLFKAFYFGILLMMITIACSDKIDRYSLVTRHNVHLKQIDTLASLSVGNGEFAYTADITGMQTFYEEYENGVSLGTQSQWGWHTVPTDSSYSIDEVLEDFESCNEKVVPYSVVAREGRAARAAAWLRANPHRLHLGIIGLKIKKSNGQDISLSDIQNPIQTLNLWTGVLKSKFEVGNTEVMVETVAHQEKDMVAFRISSEMIRESRLKVAIKFPYGKECHVCPGYNWEKEELHRSSIQDDSRHRTLIQRTLDSTSYFVQINHGTNSRVVQANSHHFEVLPSVDQSSFELSVSFAPEESGLTQDLFVASAANSSDNWQAFWQSGGAIDFSNCTDPRASELERRVILSQYLMKIQCSGSQPPQETGLTFNSWYGKFHIEMHWWHAAQFALWDRPELLANSMSWYFENLENARITAERQGYKGVRWQKMTTPLGFSSPSSVGEFLIWQQPHPIYFAELLYRAKPSKALLEDYKDLVFETADFMASFAQFNPDDGRYHLCPPLIPAQEHFRATETSDPAFELSYWAWGLKKAQEWKIRLGIDEDQDWQEVIDKLAPIPENKQYYLPTREATDAFTKFEMRRDHPIVVGTYGMLPNDDIEIHKMSRTFDEVMSEWDWESTWGWDYPMLAMCATRLGKPGSAIEALFTDTQKNTYLPNGHNYQSTRLRIYLPGNGGLLSAVAMMAAGYENCTIENPGFPKNGKWDVRWEGLERIF